MENLCKIFCAGYGLEAQRVGGLWRVFENNVSLRVGCIYQIYVLHTLVPKNTTQEAPLPYLKTLICFANSRKIFVRCIAGKELILGRSGG